MRNLRDDVKEYFATDGSVSKWWDPEGACNFHYQKELTILEENFDVNPKWKVLDVGTGKGRFAIWFAKKGCTVTALDISREMLNIANENAERERVKIDFVLGDAENLSNLPLLRNNQFDVVCCMETFDHIPHIEKAILEMTNKIKVGGYYLFTFVPESSLYWKVITAYNKLKGQPPLIGRAYQISFLHSVMQPIGIEIAKSFGISLLYPFKRIIIPLSRFEKKLKPYYSTPFIVKRCAHIVTLARKELIRDIEQCGE